MLDGLERYHPIDTRVVERQGVTGSGNEPQIRSCRITACRMRDGGMVDIDTKNLGRRAREQPASVAFTARGIEHPLARDGRQRDAIAVPMLVPDRAPGLGGEAFTGEW